MNPNLPAIVRTKNVTLDTNKVNNGILPLSESHIIAKELCKAISMFYRSDPELAAMTGIEQACVSRIFLYLNECIGELSKEDNQFKDYKIDCEYNKHKQNPKRTSKCPEGTGALSRTDIAARNRCENCFGQSAKPNLIRPDLIVHERDNDRRNLLVVEFKCGKNKHTKNDKKKLKYLTCVNGYGYELGILVRLMETYQKTFKKMRYFINGQEKPIPIMNLE